jgi:hypothetical protein
MWNPNHCDVLRHGCLVFESITGLLFSERRWGTMKVWNFFEMLLSVQFEAIFVVVIPESEIVAEM